MIIRGTNTIFSGFDQDDKSPNKTTVIPILIPSHYKDLKIRAERNDLDTLESPHISPIQSPAHTGLELVKEMAEEV